MKQGISITVILYSYCWPYRAGSRFWHLPCVLGPFGAGVLFALHIRPLKGPLDIRNGVLADSRCLYVFPEKEALVSTLSKQYKGEKSNANARTMNTHTQPFLQDIFQGSTKKMCE